TLIGTGSRAISPANDDLTIVRVPLAGTVADTSSMDLVVEVTTPGAFFHGATTAGDTHPGFVLAPGCSINDPTPVQDIDPSFADTFIVMVVNEEDSCENPEAISWLSVGTSSGTVAPAGSANSTISVDATGLAAGDYSAALCVNSNDPVTPRVKVPVSMTVAVNNAPSFTVGA